MLSYCAGFGVAVIDGFRGEDILFVDLLSLVHPVGIGNGCLPKIGAVLVILDDLLQQLGALRCRGTLPVLVCVFDEYGGSLLFGRKYALFFQFIQRMPVPLIHGFNRNAHIKGDLLPCITNDIPPEKRIFVVCMG